MKIVTGATGEVHVTSNNDGEFNQGIWGDGLVVLNLGRGLSARIVDNNTIVVNDGDLVMQGRHALIEPGTTEEVKIETGAVGYNRNDFIVARYEIEDNGHENITLAVVKGTASQSTAADPAYVSGSIRTGSSKVEYPLYRVKIGGVSITALEPLFETVVPINEKFGGCTFELVDGHPYVKYISGGEVVSKKLGSGEGTATASQVLGGATFTSSKYDGETKGTMNNLTNTQLSLSKASVKQDTDGALVATTTTDGFYKSTKIKIAKSIVKEVMGAYTATLSGTTLTLS